MYRFVHINVVPPRPTVKCGYTSVTTLQLTVYNRFSHPKYQRKLALSRYYFIEPPIEHCNLFLDFERSDECIGFTMMCAVFLFS